MNFVKELNSIQARHKDKSPAVDAALTDMTKLFCQYLTELAGQLTAKQQKQQQQQQQNKLQGDQQCITEN